MTREEVKAAVLEELTNVAPDLAGERFRRTPICGTNSTWIRWTS